MVITDQPASTADRQTQRSGSNLTQPVRNSVPSVICLKKKKMGATKFTKDMEIHVFEWIFFPTDLLLQSTP